MYSFVFIFTSSYSETGVLLGFKGKGGLNSQEMCMIFFVYLVYYIFILYKYLDIYTKYHFSNVYLKNNTYIFRFFFPNCYF